MPIKQEILDQAIPYNIQNIRRDLLPWWLKGFMGIFFFFGLITPFCFYFNYPIQIYGISSYSLIPIFTWLPALILLYKAFVSYQLWTAKDWAINSAKIDAIIGIVICTFVIIYSVMNQYYYFNLDLLFLFLYYYKLTKIQKAWYHY